MFNFLQNTFDYKQDGLYWKTGKRAGYRAGSIRPDGYRTICIKFNGKKKSYLEHRLCFYFMNNKWPTEIDHIDRNKSNNSWTNLRECTRAENNWNKVSNKGIKKSCQKFTVEIRRNGIYKYLGRFNTYQEALDARLLAEDI